VNIRGPMGERLSPEGPWYALVRDMEDNHATNWRVLCSADWKDDVVAKVDRYVESVDHDVQWQIAEQQSKKIGGVIVLALSNGAVSDVKICEQCATIIGQGKSWKQIFGAGICGACDATLI
jgi:predicted dinucleotide-utilizing enzyme